MIPKRALTKVPPSYKVEVRRLPPLLRDQEFQTTITDFLTSIVSQYYVQGKLKEQEKIDSKCYIYFQTEEKMNEFIQGYRKVFCDDKGLYYRPDIRKSFFQNQQELLKRTKNPTEGQYEDSQCFKDFLANMQNAIDEQKNKQSATQVVEIVEDKPKKFEKVKTHLIMELEKEYMKEKELKNQIEKLSNSNILKLVCEEKGRQIQRTFIFVPKAKY